MSTFKFIFLISCLIVIVNIVNCDGHVRVDLKQGTLKGTAEKTFNKAKTYYSFKGVPYAKPPIGELRFLPPQEHEGWNGELHAYETRPTCMQFSTRMRMGEPFGISGSEDCLHLNIFTPSLTDSLPVLVFDYNDNFRSGFNSTETYSPDFFIDEDVIVVHINHRLGILGYLTTSDDVIPGNAGVRDFILGLKWIQSNIKLFGGDPNRVTLMGSRGGAALVDILLHTDKAQGLFSAAIMHSGTILESVYFHDNPKAKAFEYGEISDIKTNESSILLQELQKLDVTKLLEKEHDILDGGQQDKQYQRVPYPFSPVIEPKHPNSILTEQPDDIKPVNDVPILIGFNSREGLDLISPFIYEPRLVREISDDFFFQFPIRIGYRFDKNSTVYEQAIKSIKKFYLKGKGLLVDNILDYSIYAGDILHIYPVDFAMEKLAMDLNSSLYYYVFDFRGSLNENSEYMMKKTNIPLEKRGATVCDELCYLHLCSRIRKNYEELQKLISEQSEMKVLKKTVRMWANFAKFRNPTPEDDDLLNGLKWEPVDINDKKKDKKFLQISKKLTMKSDPFDERIKFWDQFLTHHYYMAVDGLVVDKVRILKDEF